MNAKRMSCLACAFAGALALVLAGCGPGAGDLRGTVTYKGKPVAVGSVIVHGGDGIIKYGPISEEDGSYEVKGVGAGPIKLAVSSPNPLTRKVAARKKDEPPPPPPANPRWFAIPEGYADLDKSGLTFQLRRGANTFDIELK